MDSPSITIPAAPVPPRRPPTPFVAALVPVAAGVVLWLVTGSILSLCFAALGPLMVLASLVDGARSRRKALRIAEAESAEAWVAADTQLTRLHDEERRMRWHRHPDAATALLDPPLRGLSAIDGSELIVVGSGAGESRVRASGGDGERERAFRGRCSTIERVPVVVPIGGGIALRGARPVVASAARALVVQMGLRFGTAQLALVGEDLDDWGIAGFPHAREPKRDVFRLGLARGGGLPPASDAVVWLLASDDEVPEGITTVIDIAEPDHATVRTPQGVVDVVAEFVSHAQAVVIGASRWSDAEESLAIPALVVLGELAQPVSPDGLPAAIGRGERHEIVLDIVDDGPHAIVTGTTGSGKSELLVSWVTAIASRHGPERVTFVLADFKGGTAFEPLRALPQVTAVITDLDEEGARRGVSSLTAELRRREGVLAAAGARDVREVELPRLVIVVDEFAALLQEHSDLGAVFTDIAARGRALGMHLILGTQRASGVIRDALAANCPLRISLRVADAADSRVVIGSDAAAELPGGVDGRGLALARRPQDTDAVALRVALTGAADLRTIAARWEGASTPQSPWLPALPRMLPLAEVLEDAPRGLVVLGRADEPERQRQPLEMLAVGTDRGIALLGGPRSGRSSALRALAAQRRDALWIPSDAEGAWDAISALAGTPEALPALLLCDDLDARINSLPADYAQHLAQLWEQLVRGASATTFVLTASRSGGAVGRILDALPARGLLSMSNRIDHLAACGDSDGYDRARPPGRMRIADREVQVAWVDEQRIRSSSNSRRALRGAEPAAWRPGGPLTALVSVGASAVVQLLRREHPSCAVHAVSAELTEIADEGKPIIFVAEPEAWQRSWALWQRVRREGEVLIRAENAADLRQLAGVRELPPYARPHAGRAWSLVGDAGPRRVVLQALTSMTAR